jgi:transposase-like protein
MGKQQRKFAADFKARVALEALKEVRTAAQITSQFKVHVTQVSKWKKQAILGLVDVFKKGGKPDTGRQDEIDQLYQEIGKLQVENAFLKKSVYPNGM